MEGLPRRNKDNREQGRGGRRELSGRGAGHPTFSQSSNGCLFRLVSSRSNVGQTSGLSKKTPPPVKPRKPQSSRQSAARFPVADDSSTSVAHSTSSSSTYSPSSAAAAVASGKINYTPYQDIVFDRKFKKSVCAQYP